MRGRYGVAGEGGGDGGVEGRERLVWRGIGKGGEVGGKRRYGKLKNGQVEKGRERRKNVNWKGEGTKRGRKKGMEVKM